MVRRVYTIHYCPSDLPCQLYVVRPSLVTSAGMVRERRVFAAQTLEAARASLPPHVVCMGRYSDDQPDVVETWI